ncbi:13719_t:CDS:2 [Gigaspora margarita]|uniref:13719_t:CDS:1 n=1 Tax=Gigaspora margarita TaxID=4874 RepID=A0ABN7UV88_GIGMA|nr:13719_t:CDS:2 [Gigaspora margarita]
MITFIDIITNYYNSDYIKDRAILTTKNIDVEDINQQILKKILDAEKFEYFSANLVEDNNQVDRRLYSTEFLYLLTPSGMLPYRLVLKKDVPVILLYNFDPFKRLYNSTRLMIKNCYKLVLDTKIITGVNKEKRIFIPRLRLTSADSDFPFQFVRRQFPMRLSFAIKLTKHKAKEFQL